MRRRSRGSPSAGTFVDWLRQTAKPPPGVGLVSADGSLFTGIVIVDRNRPIVVLAARQSARSRPGPPIPPPWPPPPYGGYPSRTHQHRLFDEEEEAHRGETPRFWRR